MPRLVVVGVPAPPRGVPVASHYLSVDLALDKLSRLQWLRAGSPTASRKRAALALHTQERQRLRSDSESSIPALGVGQSGLLLPYPAWKGPAPWRLSCLCF